MYLAREPANGLNSNTVYRQIRIRLKTMATMLGFTNGLRDQLAISRNKIDTWVEHEKARVDALTMRRIHELESQQKNLDDKVAELLAIRLDSGLGDDGKASSRENDLLNEQEAVQDEMKLLVKKQEQQQTSLQGELMLVTQPTNCEIDL